MKKRGLVFDPPHILVYFGIVLLVVVVIILISSNFTNAPKSQNTKEIDAFKQQLAGELNPSLISGQAVKEINLPQGYDEFCVVDAKGADFGDVVDEASIRNSLIRGSERNVFLFGQGKQVSFNVDSLSVNNFPYYSCAKSKDGKLQVEVNSQGNKVNLKLPVNENYCKNAQEKKLSNGGNLCAYLDSVYYQGYKGECCSSYGYCC
ncbi:hypothetical protein HY212_03850 [Candidatus Pacearchaeota archaeon]|nr:hypothetical protein [Candidatus Pacearchaeota archaeon]